MNSAKAVAQALGGSCGCSTSVAFCRPSWFLRDRQRHCRGCRSIHRMEHEELPLLAVWEASRQWCCNPHHRSCEHCISLFIRGCQCTAVGTARSCSDYYCSCFSSSQLGIHRCRSRTADWTDRRVGATLCACGVALRTTRASLGQRRFPSSI